MQELEVLRCPSLKVLRYLLDNPDEYHSKYQIVKYSGVSKPEKILERFVEAGWVKLLYMPGFLRLYKINLENETVQAFKELFEKLGLIKVMP